MLSKYKALVKEASKRGKDSDAIKICGHFFTLNHKLIEECNSNLSSFGLLEGRFVTMLLIHEAGNIAPHELATKTGLTRATMTSIIDFLENKKYVIRIPSLTDRRSLSVQLMPEGEVVLDDVLQSQLQWLENIISPLQPNEREIFKKLLDKINNNISRVHRA